MIEQFGLLLAIALAMLASGPLALALALRAKGRLDRLEESLADLEK